MLSTSRIQLVAALIGMACSSCAGGGPHEDNQAPPQGESLVVVRRAGPDLGPAGERWEPKQAVVAAPRWRVAQDADAPRLRYAAPHDGPMFLRRSGPQLGVNVDPSNDGLRVTEVLETSLAKSAGVQVDDILLRVGDEHINRVGDVRHALQGKQPGDQVVVAVIRAGEGIVELEGTVPEPPADDKLAMDGARGGFLGVVLKDASQPADEADEADARSDSDDSDAGAPPATDAEPGVLVAEVVPNSAAWFAGLKADDRVLSIDGQAVANNADLVGAIASKEPGSMIELKYARGGEEQIARVRLGQRSPMHMFGQLQGLDGLQGLQGLQGLYDLQDLEGLQDLANLQFSGPTRFELFDSFDADDFTGFLPDLQSGDFSQLQIEIAGDEMTIERDGTTERYMRDSTGQWVPVDDASADVTADEPKC